MNAGDQSRVNRAIGAIGAALCTSSRQADLGAELLFCQHQANEHEAEQLPELSPC